MTSKAVEDQLIEAAVDQIKTTRDTSMFRPFGDAEVDSSVAEAKLVSTSEDRTIIYHIKTGEPWEILVNMLAKTLRKREDGMPVFSVTPPVGVTPFRGKTLCWLHPNHPDRDEFNSIGLVGKTCPADHIASEYEAGQHMRHRHRREYQVITEHRAAQRDEENRMVQRQQMELLQRLAEKAVGAPAPSVDIHFCKAEGCNRFFDTAQGLAQHSTVAHKA